MSVAFSLVYLQKMAVLNFIKKINKKMLLIELTDGFLVFSPRALSEG